MLANWFFFWDTTDWTGNSGIAVCPHATCMAVSVADSPTNSGGGHKYQQASPEFWETRDRYLRRFIESAVAPHLAPVPIEEAAPAPKPAFNGPTPLQDLQSRLQIAALRARAAVDEQELRASAAQVAQLILDIQKIRAQNYARAIHILLLDVF